MDYEAVKDQWSQIEDRDGIRLSWNTFPSSRMVSEVLFVLFRLRILTLPRKHPA
jgi:protein transport protein SEC23